MLCAGITTYQPVKMGGAGPGKKVAIVGIGGLGHLGLQVCICSLTENTLHGLVVVIERCPNPLAPVVGSCSGCGNVCDQSF